MQIRTVSGETYPKAKLSDRLEFGAGGASALDVNLYRSAADQLATDDILQVLGYDGVNEGGEIHLASPLGWGAPTSAKPNWFIDVYVGTLRLRGYDGTTHKIPLAVDYPNNRINLADAGILIGADVNLYRSAANRLRTEDDFEVGNLGYNICLDYSAPSIYFGNRSSAWDVVLYRPAANKLRTDDEFQVGNVPYNIRLIEDTQMIAFGDRSTSWDVNLYRSAADVLKTDDSLDYGIALLQAGVRGIPSLDIRAGARIPATSGRYDFAGAATEAYFASFTVPTGRTLRIYALGLLLASLTGMTVRIYQGGFLRKESSLVYEEWTATYTSADGEIIFSVRTPTAGTGVTTGYVICGFD